VKSAAQHPEFHRWRPINSFLHDEVDIGVSRLVDAMPSFGTDGLVGASSPEADGNLSGALEQLAASHETTRSNHALRREHFGIAM
jgi:hypothetical protein